MTKQLKISETYQLVQMLPTKDCKERKLRIEYMT